MNLAFYCLLFTAVGVGFIFVHLVAGKLIRPNKPGAEKKAIYECGEPTIGSAWIQFDLRFYVVALLFVIFDVEVAFFFPWAVVFGRANDVAHLDRPKVAKQDEPTAAEARAYRDYCDKVLALAPAHPEATPEQIKAYIAVKKMTDDNIVGQFKDLVEERRRIDLDLGMTGETGNPIEQARQLGWMAFVDILVFFGVLLVGFAYLWRRGDLAWVRSVAAERATPEPPPPPPPSPAPVKTPEPALTAPVSAH
jgi:NADH-quinone oxidoreductase subunit A